MLLSLLKKNQINMKKVLGFFLAAILIILTLIYCRITVPTLDPAIASSSDSHFASSYLAMQANQFALLQVYLSAFGIVLSALGIMLAAAAIWGYNELRAMVIKIAVNKINDI